MLTSSIIGIDPSIRACGIAQLQKDHVVAWRLLRGPGKQKVGGRGGHKRKGRAGRAGGGVMEWTARADAMAQRVITWITKHSEPTRYRPSHTEFNTTHIYIEMPQRFGGSGRGRMGLQTESVQKLYYLVGNIVGRLDALTLIHNRISIVHLVHPIKWKGQVPKEVTRRRMLGNYPELPKDEALMELGAKAASNVFDAIGIAHWGLLDRIRAS